MNRGTRGEKLILMFARTKSAASPPVPTVGTIRSRLTQLMLSVAMRCDALRFTIYFARGGS